MTGYPVRERWRRFAGAMFDVVTDRVEFPDGQLADRDYLRHVGAVGVVALDEAERVVLVRQYRHPVGRELWELPAGLADVAGESPLQVAVRELAEETDLRADRWDLLVDLHTSPGCSTERIRIYLARGLAPTGGTYAREHEEATMTVTRIPLAAAVDMIFTGEITNASAVAGVLAAARARDDGWRRLRPVDHPLTDTRPAGDGPAAHR